MAAKAKVQYSDDRRNEARGEDLDGGAFSSCSGNSMDLVSILNAGASYQSRHNAPVINF